MAIKYEMAAHGNVHGREKFLILRIDHRDYVGHAATKLARVVEAADEKVHGRGSGRVSAL
jgi:hypothetical protein